MSDPIDLSALDPMADEARWEARVSETVEQAGLVEQLDLTSLTPIAIDDAVLSIVEQADALRGQDLSALSPFGEEEDAVVASIVTQSALLEDQDLTPLAGFPADGDAVVASVLERARPRSGLTQVEPDTPADAQTRWVSPVVALAPRALTVAACLAAAAWLLVWFAPPAGTSSSGQSASASDPALVLMSWVESGDGLTTDQMRVVTGSAR